MSETVIVGALRFKSQEDAYRAEEGLKKLFDEIKRFNEVWRSSLGKTVEDWQNVREAVQSSTVVKSYLEKMFQVDDMETVFSNVSDYSLSFLDEVLIWPDGYDEYGLKMIPHVGQHYVCFEGECWSWARLDRFISCLTEMFGAEWGDLLSEEDLSISTLLRIAALECHNQ